MGKLEFVENKVGDPANFVLHRELTPSSLDLLKAHQGKDVEIHVTRTTWLNRGEYEDEDVNHRKIEAYGKLVGVTEKGVKLEIKTGKTDYWYTTAVIPTGSIEEFLFHQHVYQEKHAAEMMTIEQLSVGEHTFQLGRVSRMEQGQASA